MLVTVDPGWSSSGLVAAASMQSDPMPDLQLQRETWSGDTGVKP